MSYTAVSYGEVEQRAPGMHFMREALDCENLGFTVVDADPDWTGMEHDHADDDHEEVYYLVDGGATLTVDGDAVELSPGEAVRVAPAASRQLSVDEAGATLVVVGAP